ncbi:MAG: SPFH domain-containing protein [Planctomycetota bacterium]
MRISQKRAEHTAVTGLVISTVFTIVSFILSRWSGSVSVFDLGWLLLATLLIWFVLWVQFHQRSLAEREKLDIAQLAKSPEGMTIFQTHAESGELFATAQRRLQLLEKWFIPVFAGIIAVYMITIGLYLFRLAALPEELAIKQPLVNAVYMTAIAFVSFIISRYTLGMSAQTGWKPLRSGASYMLCCAVLAFLLAIGLALFQFKFAIILAVLRYAIPVLLIILGVETALNIVLDIYRPRAGEQYARAAFDSRLLGMVCEPGQIIHTAAGALDYQFGFKVSQTWFYKLIAQAIVPLVLFSVVVLYLLSALFVVRPDEEAILERFGKAVQCRQTGSIGPGLHLKFPWPIDIVYKYPVKKIRQINIGFVPKDRDGDQNEPLLWDVEHYQQEYNIMVATGTEEAYSGEVAVPVSLVRAAVPVQYHVKDLYSFLYNHEDSEKVLEAICYRQLVQLAASAKIESELDEQSSSNPASQDRGESLLGAGRGAAAGVLVERIQAAADKAGLGVEIIFVGLQGVHPPPKVAGDYQAVIASVQQKQARILDAQGYSKKTLSSLAGSVEAADKLCELYQRHKDLEQADSTSAATARAGQELEKAFNNASGKVFAQLSEAQSYAWEKSTLAKATGLRFAEQLKAYQAAEKIYKQQLRLAMLEGTLASIRKYVVIADENDLQIFEVDVKEKLTPSLYELSGIEKETKK